MTVCFNAALAIYTRSPAAYDAISSFKVLQLPSVSTLSSYSKSNLESSGEVEVRLAEESCCYKARVQQHLEAGKNLPPIGEGVLIFDEVKVAAKLHWNSRDDSLVGHAMTPDDMATLQDLYATLDNKHAPEKADYVMQTLWRDLSSDCDIVGPHYMSAGSFDAKSILACVFDSLRKFHAHGFNVHLLVCDGASSNLSMIKFLLGKKGPFESTTAPYEIPTWFPNPFTGEKLHITICPSHQVI